MATVAFELGTHEHQSNIVTKYVSIMASEDRSRAKFRNVLYVKYTSENWQFPS
jgi:trehalose/maltose hydrolase-like predicted phosphorylase